MQKLFVFLCFLIILDLREKTALDGLTIVEKLIFSLGITLFIFLKVDYLLFSLEKRVATYLMLIYQKKFWYKF
jgi:hypothetical protein